MWRVPSAGPGRAARGDWHVTSPVWSPGAGLLYHARVLVGPPVSVTAPVPVDTAGIGPGAGG